MKSGEASLRTSLTHLGSEFATQSLVERHPSRETVEVDLFEPTMDKSSRETVEVGSLGESLRETPMQGDRLPVVLPSEESHRPV